jgi:hypothetical protein
VNPADRRTVKRRYCPACQTFSIPAGAETCARCAAPASRRYPKAVPVGEDYDAEVELAHE